MPVDGANIELLTWGEVGKPGLIFVHGNSAHADWWSFIAPFLADRLPRRGDLALGHGRLATGARPIPSRASPARSGNAPRRPASTRRRSSRSTSATRSAARRCSTRPACIPERMRAARAGRHRLRRPADRASRKSSGEGGRKAATRAGRGPPHRTRPNRVYATLEEALTRFRFMPPQAPGNLYVADFIARRSLKRAPMPDGSGEGWTWKFDPFLWAKLDRSAMQAVDASQAPCRWRRSSATARRSCSAAKWAGRPTSCRPACRRSPSRIPSITSWSISRWRLWRRLRTLLAVWPA